ncbi:MAG: hypothetical protein K2W96_04080 [Gemmataceae bacterium]|nr:hypothetical protein [Gemmataceae bacterium]
MSEPLAPRRIVLLKGDDNQGEVESVLAEYSGKDVTGARLHGDLRKQAEAHPGRVVAGEWHGPLGWTRFIWARA